jgi:hypothetical protein
MKSLSRVILMGLLLFSQSCATSRLWDDTNPNDRVWISADKITEQALKTRGVDYQPYALKQGNGYLVHKSSWGRMKDYHLRMLGTPVTLVVDTATTVVVVGFYALLTDPEGTICLIEALSK